MEQSDFEAVQMIAEKIVHGMHRNTSSMHGPPKLENAPVVALVDKLIEQAIQARASDIHVEPQGDMLRIRFRIDGELCEMHELPDRVHAFFVSRIKIMSLLDITEKRIPQDGRFVFPYKGRNIDVRVSTMPTICGEEVVLRLLNSADRLLHINELGFSPKNKAIFEKLCHKPYGMLLTTGPVNSGKTTTLYAALNELNEVNKNIVSLEDPVEYCLPGINQIQVTQQGKLTFPVGLRSVLRQDPDIIMVGEIRDAETAEIAVRAALTGHLVFTTLHTNNAVGSIFRLLDMGIEPYLLAASVRGILAQRLVRRICPDCREAYVVAAGSEEAAFWGERYQNRQLYHGRGCPECNGTGYKGRLAIHEFLLMTDELRQALQAGADVLRLQAIARQNMISMQQDGIEKILAGETTTAEVVKAAYDGA